MRGETQVREFVYEISGEKTVERGDGRLGVVKSNDGTRVESGLVGE